MNIKISKVKVLCKKDFNDFFKNPTMLVSALIPLMFIILYKNLNLPNVTEDNQYIFLLNIGTLINCTMTGIMVVSTSIAEEKEKFTLRTLMLSNISGTEFLLSKMSVGILITMLGNVLVFFLSGAALSLLPLYLPVIMLGIIAMNLVSAVVGLLSRDQMSCGVLQVPVLLVFLIPSMLGNANGVLGKIAMATPLNAMMNVFYYGADGELFSGKAVMHLGILLGWIAAAAVVFGLVYRKRGLDN